MTDIQAILEVLRIPPISHFVFGALGGYAYIAFIHTAGYKVRLAEFLSRPFAGGIAAMYIIETFNLPNHANSIAIGTVGILCIGAIINSASRMLSKWTGDDHLLVKSLMPSSIGLGFALRDDIEREVVQRVEEVNRRKEKYP